MPALALLAILVLPALAGAETEPLTADDFAGLSFEDGTGDDYTFYCEGEGFNETVLDSWGEKGKYDCVDIRSVTTTYDEGAGRVSIEVRLWGRILYGMSMSYYLCVVGGDHQQTGEILDPQSITGGFSVSYYDSDNLLVRFAAEEDGTVSSVPDIPSLQSDFSDNGFEVEMDVSDLEDAGVEGGSGFGLYVYAHRMGTGFKGYDGWFSEYTWDTAGVGAATVPEEFNVQSGDGWSLGTTALIVLVVVIVVVVAVAGGLAHSRSKRKGQGVARGGVQPLVDDGTERPQAGSSTGSGEHEDP